MTKLEAQSAIAESDMRGLLLRLLPDAIEHGTALFTNSEFNPHRLNPAHLSEYAEQLLELAHECERLHQQLLYRGRSVGSLYLEACAELAGPDEHRRGPRRLAEWLLNEIRTSAG